jgi:hypothetical protein
MFMINSPNCSGQIVSQNDYINPDSWFGKTWVLGVSCGISGFWFVVEADNASDAVDEFVDSRYGHLLEVEESEFDEEIHTRAGNCGVSVDLTDLVVLERCEVTQVPGHYDGT